MPARKTTSKKTTSATRTSPGRKLMSRKAPAPHRMLPTATLKEYATPIALLGAGVTLVGGYLLKDAAGGIVRHAMQFATRGGARAATATSHAAGSVAKQVRETSQTLADELSLGSLLHHVGVARPSMLSGIAGPLVGLTCGLVAGSVLTHFFGDTLLAQLSTLVSDPPAKVSVTSAEPEEPARAEVNGVRG